MSGSKYNDFLSDGEYIFSDQIGTSVIVIEDLAGFEVFSNGADLFTEVEWTTIEKPVI